MDENDNLSCQQRSTNLQVRSLNIGLKVRFYCSGLICRVQFQSHMCTYVCCFQVVENSRFGYCRVKAAPRLRDIIQCKNTAAFTPANTVYNLCSILIKCTLKKKSSIKINFLCISLFFEFLMYFSVFRPFDFYCFFDEICWQHFCDHKQHKINRF